jgi:hypothetical protein
MPRGSSRAKREARTTKAPRAPHVDCVAERVLVARSVVEDQESTHEWLDVVTLGKIVVYHGGSTVCDFEVSPGIPERAAEIAGFGSTVRFSR